MNKTVIVAALASALVTPSYAELHDDITNKSDKVMDPMTKVDEAVNTAKSALQDELETAKTHIRQGAKEIEEKHQPEIEAAQNKYGQAKYQTDKGNNYPIETNTERTQILVPTVTVNFKEIEIPTIHTKMDTTSISVPTFGRCELQTDVPQTKTEWVPRTVASFFGKKVITHLPVTTFWFGRTTVPCHKGWGEVKIDVPQFQAGTTVLRIPDTLEWNQESLKLNLPQLTIRDFPEQIKDAEKDLSGTEVAISTEIDALEAQAQARMVQESVRKVIMEMDATRETLIQDKVKAQVTLNENIAKIDAAIGQIDAVKGYNTAAIRATAVDTRNGLVQQRDTTMNKYDEALAKVETKRAELFEEIDKTKRQATGNDSASVAAPGS